MHSDLEPANKILLRILWSYEALRERCAFSSGHASASPPLKMRFFAATPSLASAELERLLLGATASVIRR
jgi:hypothetical protein